VSYSFLKDSRIELFSLSVCPVWEWNTDTCKTAVAADFTENVIRKSVKNSR
jgi:hypothetical protein